MAYIKLEDAIEVCNKYKTLHKKENSRLGMGIVNDIYLDIDNLPTADVVEVKHGKWDINVGMNYNKERICPVCKERIEGNHWNFCSNCGADMRGDAE